MSYGTKIEFFRSTYLTRQISYKYLPLPTVDRMASNSRPTRPILDAPEQSPMFGDSKVRAPRSLPNSPSYNRLQPRSRTPDISHSVAGALTEQGFRSPNPPQK